MAASFTGRLGRYVSQSTAGETVRAFVPPPLPPSPAVDLSRVQALLEDASQALGRLDGLTTLLPDPSLFIYHYVRKEAVLSSQIEGTQSSLSDLLLFEDDEAPGVPLDDVVEVSNYVAALDHGLRRIREGFPLSLRLIKEIHGVLLAKGRGSERNPGEFRRSQNWIGGTRPGNALFVPPPAEMILECMGALETFLHAADPSMPVLVKAALVHVQFESIHPFLDGNGRLGRLLITFLLCTSGMLREPLLYLSLYFKANRQSYYDLLNRVRSEGDWERWVEFFLDGVKQTAEQASDSARRILDLVEEDRRKIEELGRPAATVLLLHSWLRRKPITSIPMAAKALNLSAPTVGKALGHLQRLDIVRETTGRQRHRLFVYQRYLSTLSEGTG